MEKQRGAQAPEFRLFPFTGLIGLYIKTKIEHDWNGHIWQIHESSTGLELTGINTNKIILFLFLTQVSILTTLVLCFGAELGWSWLLNFIYTVLQFVSPQLINLTIGFVESDEPLWRGYLYIAGLVNFSLSARVARFREKRK